MIINLVTVSKVANDWISRIQFNDAIPLKLTLIVTLVTVYKVANDCISWIQFSDTIPP